MRSKLLTCCRIPEELVGVEDLDGNAQRHIQSNLVAEKTGFRCTTCSKLHPIMSTRYNGMPLDLKALSKPLGIRLKCKKAAKIFRGDHYYAINKKSLLCIPIDPDGPIPANETPIMGSVWHAAVSPSGRTIATETDSGTAAIIDAMTKETISKRRNLRAQDTLHFSDDDTLVYFRQNDGLFRWHFREDRETKLWQPPADWLAPGLRPVSCNALLEVESEQLIFQLATAKGSFALVLEGAETVKLIPLPDIPVLAELSCFAGGYTLPQKDRILILDREFHPVDAFPYPVVTTCNDGGGLFPIRVFSDDIPRQVHLSSSGKWALFDYHTLLLLLDRESDAIRYAVWSNTFTSSTRSGFLDDQHLWYTWADSTYIMEI